MIANIAGAVIGLIGIPIGFFMDIDLVIYLSMGLLAFNCVIAEPLMKMAAK